MKKKKIRLKDFIFVLDVDGVLTTGQFLYSTKGKEYKVFGPHDSDGLKLLKDKIKIEFITADKRGYKISERRVVKDMGFSLDLVPEEKREAYFKKKYDLKRLIYMGDGFYDVWVLKQCYLGIAPKSARKEAIKAADFVTQSKAGEGAVLDACLEILKRFE